MNSSSILSDSGSFSTAVKSPENKKMINVYEMCGRLKILSVSGSCNIGYDQIGKEGLD